MVLKLNSIFSKQINSCRWISHIFEWTHHISKQRINFPRDADIFKRKSHMFEGNKQVCLQFYNIYVYIYVINYIHHIIYIYTHYFQFSMFRIISNIYFQICSYIQKTTLNHIKIFKTSVYNTKHTQHTKLHFSTFANIHIFKNYTFIEISISHTFYMARLWRA